MCIWRRKIKSNLHAQERCMISKDNKYVIVTPAFNEEKHIEDTIKCVVSQIFKPFRWIIVDDGSTDDMVKIIQQYTKQYNWIKYVFRPKVSGQSYYGSNVYAIQEGLKYLDDINYTYLAILDADISLQPDYYEKLISRMQKDDKLGIASGVYVDRIEENKFRKVLNDRRSTPKALMVFRKQCFEDIGGFIPMKYGGEDTIACFMARMKGWKTWSFPDIDAIHNKPVGTGHAKNLLKIRFRQGKGEYFIATHPLFMLVKSIRRCIKEQPYIFGGLARLWGFIYANFIGEPCQISEELIKYIRKEQFDRVFQSNKIPKEHQPVESYEKS